MTIEPMLRKETSKETIVRLFKIGKSATDIIRDYNFPKATVYAAISEYKKTIIPKKLTINNYVAAHCMGITRKKDLAAFFGVNRKTINRFENSRRTQQHLTHYMELQGNGYDLNEVLQRLTSIHETLVIFEPGSYITQKIAQAIKLLTDVPKKDNFPEV